MESLRSAAEGRAGFELAGSESVSAWVRSQKPLRDRCGLSRVGIESTGFGAIRLTSAEEHRAPALLHAVRWNQGRTTRAVCARCSVKIRCRKLQPLSSCMFFRYISCGVAGSGLSLQGSRRLVLELRLPRLLLASPPRHCCSHGFCVHQPLL